MVTNEMRFGDHIRKIRKDDLREYTLEELSGLLGISLTFLSDIENNRRLPFGTDKINLFADVYHLSKKERERLYDLAGKERKAIPSDIEDIMFENKVGSMATMALRETKAGYATEEDWKALIRIIEERKHKEYDPPKLF